MKGCTWSNTSLPCAWARKARGARGTTASVILAALPGALSSALSAALMTAVPQEARAQGAAVARVASVQRKVEKRSRVGGWRAAGAGASVGIGEGLRTGKRSKVDLKFADGSVLRLGQLSSIEIQSAKGARLTGGQVLFSQLRPGRVLAGSGAAEIRGSVGIVSLAPDGSADFALFSGAMDVTAGGKTVSVPPGRAISMSTGGVLSALRAAAPSGFAQSKGAPDLLDEPENAPFVGSALNEQVRDSPERASTDQILPQSINVANNSGIPGGIPTGGPGSPGTSPFPTPFPTVPAGQDLIGVRPLLSRHFDNRVGSPSAPPLSTRFYSTPKFVLGMFQAAPRLVEVQAPQQLPELPDEASSTSSASIGANETLDVAQDLSLDLDTRAALDHIEAARGGGRELGGDASLVGAISDAGNAVYGARIRGFGSIGKAYFQATLLPLKLRSEGSTRDYSAVADAFVLLRDERGQIQIGRQRFVSGPTQSSLFGSMVRQGGRETMDAIRIAPRLKNGVQLEAAYILDAFPRNLPFQISGAQHALYGRAALRRPTFSAGLNLLKYSSSDTDGTTGATVDFALPLARRQVELYGELGRDPFRRTLTTFGLAFPGLYERTNFDAFLEYARLHRRGGSGVGAVGAPPSEVSLRVYKSVGRNLNTVAALSRFGNGEGYNFSLGLSIGARTGAQASGGIGQ